MDVKYQTPILKLNITFKILNLKINKNWKLNDWKCWSVHTCPRSSWKPQLSLLWTSQYCLAGCRWQVSMEIYAPPEKRQFSKFSILKMHPWDVGVLVFFYSNTNWTKITVRSCWMLKSVSSHIFLVWRMSTVWSGYSAVTLLASTFCFSQPAPPKGLSTKWHNTKNSI